MLADDSRHAWRVRGVGVVAMIVAAFGVIVGAILLMWAVGAASGSAGDDADAMLEEIKALERITKS